MGISHPTPNNPAYYCSMAFPPPAGTGCQSGTAWQKITGSSHWICWALAFPISPITATTASMVRLISSRLWLPHTGLESFHVLAHDYGDTVAQELLARQLDGSGCGKWLSCCFFKWRIISRDPSRPADSKTVAQPYRRICLTFSQAMLNSAATLARYLVQIPSPQSKSYRIFGG